METQKTVGAQIVSNLKLLAGGLVASGLYSVGGWFGMMGGMFVVLFVYHWFAGTKS